MEINIKQMIDNMPPNLSDIEKIRYIYISFGEMFAYNRDFIYEHLSDITSKEMYDERVNIDFNSEENNEEKIKVTCKQIADSCIQTMNKLFTENVAELIGYKEGYKHHVAILVTLKNKHYFMDLHNDLYRIQKGMKTEYFAPSKQTLRKEKNNYIPIDQGLKGIRCTPIAEEELKIIDNKIGYNRNGIYMDDAVEQLRLEMQDEKNWEKYIKDYEKINSNNKKEIISQWKLDFIFKYIKNNVQKKDKMGIMEVEKFFRKLYYSILTKKEQNQANLIISHIHIDDKPSVMYKVELSKDTVYYIYNDEDNGFRKATLSDIIKMNEEGKLTFDNKHLNNYIADHNEWYNRW